MENPQSGQLKHRDVVRGLPFLDTDYCQWGTLYRKWTRLWGNCSTFVTRLCDKATCHAVLRGCHVHSAQDRLRRGREEVDRCYKTRELYVIPAELCLHICLATEAALVRG